MSVEQLKKWFVEKLEPLPSFEMRRGDYNLGVDRLAEPYKALIAEAWRLAGTGTSYQEMCVAFFTAARKLQKLTIEETSLHER